MEEVVFTPLKESKSTPTIERPPRLSWDRVCLLYGRRKAVRGNVNGGGSSTLYTVPTGKVFLLLAATISSIAKNAVSGGPQFTNATDLEVNLGNSIVDRLISVKTGWADNTGIEPSIATASISPVIPLVYPEGFSVVLENELTNTYADATAVGYEVDSQIFFSQI